jgi:hypothetical protein
MRPMGFEPAILASERTQIHVLNGPVTGISVEQYTPYIFHPGGCLIVGLLVSTISNIDSVQYTSGNENQKPKIFCIPNPKCCKPTYAIIITVVYSIPLLVCVRSFCEHLIKEARPSKEPV